MMSVRNAGFSRRVRTKMDRYGECDECGFGMGNKDLSEHIYNLKKGTYICPKCGCIQKEHYMKLDDKHLEKDDKGLNEILQRLNEYSKEDKDTRFDLFTEMEKNVILAGLHNLTTLSNSKLLGRRILMSLVREIHASETGQNTSESEEQAEIRGIVPFTLHCPFCGNTLPKDPQKYIRNINHQNEYTFKCSCGVDIYFYLDDCVDYKQNYIEIGLNFSDTEES